MNFNELYKKIAELDQHTGDSSVQTVIDQLLDGDLDMYDVYADPKGRAQEEVSMMIEKHLNELSQETGLDLKHDLQAALEATQNWLEKNYGHSGDQEELADEVIDRIGGNTSPDSINFHVNNLLKEKGMSDDLADDIKDLIASKLDVMNLDRSATKEGNAFTGALAKTDKGEEFNIGGKEFTDTSDYDENVSEGSAVSPELKATIDQMLDQNISPADIGKKLGSMMPFKPSAKEIEAAAKRSADLKSYRGEPATVDTSTMGLLKGRGAQIDAAVRRATEDVEETNECGMPTEGPSPSTPPQQDSVNMSINMSGSGKGGIRDLLNILKDIDGKGGSDDFRLGHGKMTIIDEPADLGDIMGGAEEESFANAPAGASGPHTYGIDAAIHDGNDLHKRNKKNYTFGNPEEVKVHLESLYQKYKKH